jgi:hypothetical protein
VSSDLALFTGVIAGPLAWLISLEAGYIASYAICAPGRGAAVHVALLVPLALIAAGAWLGWAIDRRPGERNSSSALMRRMALWLCAGFAGLVLVTYVPVWALLPCR